MGNFHLFLQLLYYQILFFYILECKEATTTTRIDWSTRDHVSVTPADIMDPSKEGSAVPSLKGAHICKRHIFRAAYRYVPVTYRCWDPQPCPTQPKNKINETDTDMMEPLVLAENSNTTKNGALQNAESDSTRQIGAPQHTDPKSESETGTPQTSEAERARNTSINSARMEPEGTSTRNQSGFTEPKCANCPEPCYEYRAKKCVRFEMKCILEDAVEYFCCPGYENIDGECFLVQACYENNGNCEQICHHDQDGSSYCGCFPGYQLINKTHCQDIDECQEQNGGCSHKCNNVPGTFYCSCDKGYGLTDTKMCKEIDECEIGNGGCEHQCINTPGKYYCVCKAGFKLHNGYACKDWDECVWLNGGCSHYCFNFNGGYRCICPENMLLGADGRTCHRPMPSSSTSSTTKSTTRSTTTAKSTRFREPLAPGWTKPTDIFIPGRDEPLTSNKSKSVSLEVLIVPLVVLALLTASVLLAALFIRRKRGKNGSDSASDSTEEVNYDVTVGPVMGSVGRTRLPLFLAFNNDSYSREPSQQI